LSDNQQPDSTDDSTEVEIGQERMAAAEFTALWSIYGDYVLQRDWLLLAKHMISVAGADTIQRNLDAFLAVHTNVPVMFQQPSLSSFQVSVFGNAILIDPVETFSKRPCVFLASTTSWRR
jgi:hypothetical protein